MVEMEADAKAGPRLPVLLSPLTKPSAERRGRLAAAPTSFATSTTAPSCPGARCCPTTRSAAATRYGAADRAAKKFSVPAKT